MVFTFSSPRLQHLLLPCVCFYSLSSRCPLSAFSLSLSLSFLFTPSTPPPPPQCLPLTVTNKTEQNMVDDFIVCIDRIIASTTCFGSVVVVGDGLIHHVEPPVSVSGSGSGEAEGCSSSSSSSSKKDDGDDDVVECRICQEEDQVQAMEAPCSCNGTLKFAHRKCIQRWCNKKGNTICEICNQVFSPNYSLPPVRSNDIMALDLRQEWEHNTDLHVALVSPEHQLLQSEYEDYAITQTSSIACLRTITLTLLIILLVRQALMVAMNSATSQDSSIIFNFQMSLLQFASVLLPCCAMARAWYVIQNRRRRQV